MARHQTNSIRLGVERKTGADAVLYGAMALALAAALAFFGLRALDGDGGAAAPITQPAATATLTAGASSHTFYIVASDEQRQALHRQLADLQLTQADEKSVRPTYDVVVIPPDAPLAAWQPIFDAQADLYEAGISSAVVDMR